MSQDHENSRIVVGRYRLGRVLGQGAHGKVYLAEDLGRGGRHVALKIMRRVGGAPDFDDPATKALYWFRHPNWAEILDMGVVDDEEWFQATRYINGESLESLEGPQDPEFVRRFLEDGARVLGALHRIGLIHYDVTPANFLIEHTPEGYQFVLTDGGLAHLGEAADEVRGTPLYTAPELQAAHHHDHRVDLYSLGLVGYKLATGHGPFDAAGVDPIRMRRMHDAPSIATSNPDAPEDLVLTIGRLLTRNQEERTPDAFALLQELSGPTSRAVARVNALEARALAAGGPLAGSSLLLERATAAFQAHSKRTSATQRIPQPTDEDTLPPLMLLTGPRQSGGTRLAAELAFLARKQSMNILLLAGRNGTAPHNAPLTMLHTAVASLLPQHAALDSAAANAATTSNSRRDRAYAKSKAINSLVDNILTTAQHRSTLLLVEDYDELSELAKDALRALARDLLTHPERYPGAQQPSLFLVIDAATTDTNSFLPWNHRDAIQYQYEVPRLSTQDISDYIFARLPTSPVRQSDLEELRRACGGSPSALVALVSTGLLEGAISSDMRPTDWSSLDWRKLKHQTQSRTAFSDMPQDWTSPPGSLVLHLALIEPGLSVPKAASIYGSHHLPSSPLWEARRDHDRTHLVLSSPVVREHVLRMAPPDLLQAARCALLSLLEDELAPEYVLARARLHMDTQNPNAAVTLLRSHEPTLDAETRYSMQLLLQELTGCYPTLLTDAAARGALACLLERGPEAVAVAQKLAESITNHTVETATVLRVAEVLEDASDPTTALALLDSIDVAHVDSDSEKQAIVLRKAALEFDHGRNERGHELLGSFSALAARSTPATPELEASHASLCARQAFLARNFSLAVSELRRGVEASRSCSEIHLRARLLNNLAAAEAHSDAPHAISLALEHFSESLNLKRELGDTKGTIATCMNLARLHASQQSLVAALSACQEALRAAHRYGLTSKVIEGLRLEATLYDRLHRPLKALQNLSRALDVNIESPSIHAAALDLAPLAAALGDLPLAEESLRRAAAHARRRDRSDSALANYHLACATVATHMGLFRRAALSLRRVVARRQALTPEDAVTLRALCFAVDRRDLLSDVPPTAELSTSLQDDYKPLAEVLQLAEAGQLPRSTAQLNSDPSSALLIPRLPAGAAGRLIAEIFMAQAARIGGAGAVDLLSKARIYAQHGQLETLYARAAAIQAAVCGWRPLADSARVFSMAVQKLTCLRPARCRQHTALPKEFTEAVRSAPQPASSLTPATDDLQELHATAHRMLLKAGTSPFDDRRSHVLKRVLEAGAQLRTGASEEALLESMTRHIVEITGAQRAGVVLLREKETLELLYSNCSSDAKQDLALDTLSHTVIGKVLDSRKQVYLPFLFESIVEDEELAYVLKRSGIASKHSIICTPIVRRNELYGAIYADSASSADFDEVDMEVMNLFAEQAASAIESERLVRNLQSTLSRLKAAQDKLVEGERLRVLGEVTSGVAHEFNNYLTAVRARIQMLQLTGTREDLDENLRLIQRAVDDATDVVKRLQGHCRRQAQMDYRTVDLFDVCRDAIGLLRPLWTSRPGNRRRVDVSVDVPRGLLVRGNATELREVVTNLVKNALDAVGARGSVNVAARRIGRRITLTVADDGPGISEENLGRVFEAFFTTKGERGTGLGLPLSKQIVERHGGTLELGSRVGRGAQAMLVLPSIQVDPLPNGPAPSSRAMRQKGPCYVLLVDDETDVRHSLGESLKALGFTVEEASDASAAIASLSQRTPDVLLTDFSLGATDGIQLATTVRHTHPSVPVVLMSGCTRELDRQAADEAGIRRTLEKPLDIHELAEVLREAVVQQPSAGR